MYNMDGRAFIKQAIHDLSVESNGTRFFQHFVMNLPATAIEFLGRTNNFKFVLIFTNCTK